MRVGLDATPLIGPRSGVGRYVEGLLAGLAELARDDLEVVLTVLSLRGRLPDDVTLPARTRAAPRRAPARLLHRAWRVGPLPPVELLTGRLDVVAATNFVLPPSRAPGVVTVHDLTYLRYPETVTPAVAAYRELVPRALRRAGAVVTVSAAVAAEVEEAYGVPPDRLVVAPNGVDPGWAAAAPAPAQVRRRLGVPADYLLFVGNLEPRKNLGLLVRAHAAARRADPAVPRLVLVGAPGWGDRWQGAAPHPDDVVLAGRVGEADLRALVAGARAVCAPSRYEGFGLPVVEAAAAGRPVLASDIAAHREVAAPGTRLLDPADVDAWAEALTAPPADQEADRRARRAHAAAYTWRRSAERHLATWRAVAG